MIISPRIKDLPAKVRANACYNHCMQREFPARRFEDLDTKHLQAAFIWEISPEGHDYWDDINNKYSK